MKINDYDLYGFEKDLEEFGIELTAKQEEKFVKYYELLVKWNEFMNLTAITDFHEVLKKHFVDSLSMAKAFPYLYGDFQNLIDIGTGAGFPGVPLKIVYPDLTVTLIDSLNKRVNFLNETIESLNLENVTVIHGRAEDYARKEGMRESFDLCVSRAVANLGTLAEYCIPFVGKDGFFISYKSEKAALEYENAKKAIDILGGKLEKLIEFKLPGTDFSRSLFVIKKIKATSLKYPRKAGIPGREPIK